MAPLVRFRNLASECTCVSPELFFTLRIPLPYWQLHKENLDMKADYVPVSKLFGDSREQYIIPVYQRRYVWTQENQWEKLWTDLQNTSDDPSEEHFTGAILLKQLPKFTGGVQKYEIVDGQQRLTTFQILLCAISTICHNHPSPGYRHLGEKADLYLFNDGLMPDDDVFDKYKLLPPESNTRNSDRSAIISLIEGKRDNQSGRIYEAYDYFVKQITEYIGAGIPDKRRQLQILLNTLLDRFGVVQILLNSHEEPPAKIFESLNTKGRTLAEFDHLRNNLFLRTLESKWDDLHQNYWIDFEDHYWEEEKETAGERIKLSDLFLQHFLMAKLGRENIALRQLFDVYDTVYLRNTILEVEDEFAELQKYSEVYKKMVDSKVNSEISHQMEFYKHLKITNLYPFVLFVVNEVKISESDSRFPLLFKILQSYVIQRTLCVPRSNEVFNQFFLRIKEICGEYHFSLENLIRLLSNPISKIGRWPNDQEVKGALEGKWVNDIDLASDEQNIVRYILYRIDQKMREDNNLTEQVSIPYSQFNLEHIMPRSWKKAEENWPLLNDAPPNHSQNRDSVLWNIGNLTILTRDHNWAVGDASYANKCQSFSKNSNLMLNKKIPHQYPVDKGWDVDQILKRGDDLFGYFCKIWPFAKHFTELFKEPLFMSDAMIQSANYVFLTDTRNEEIELFDITSYSTEVRGVTIRGDSVTLKKRHILFACPASVRNDIKPPYITQPNARNQNPRSIRKHTVDQKFLDSAQQYQVPIEIVTRRGNNLRGTVEDHDQYTIYMKINGQPMIVYKHGVRKCSKWDK